MTAEILEQCFQTEIFLIVIPIKSGLKKKKEILLRIYILDQCCYKCVLQLHQYFPLCHTNK